MTSEKEEMQIPYGLSAHEMIGFINGTLRSSKIRKFIVSERQYDDIRALPKSSLNDLKAHYEFFFMIRYYEAPRTFSGRD